MQEDHDADPGQTILNPSDMSFDRTSASCIWSVPILHIPSVRVKWITYRGDDVSLLWDTTMSSDEWKRKKKGEDSERRGPDLQRERDFIQDCVTALRTSYRSHRLHFWWYSFTTCWPWFRCNALKSSGRQYVWSLNFPYWSLCDQLKFCPLFTSASTDPEMWESTMSKYAKFFKKVTNLTTHWCPWRSLR